MIKLFLFIVAISAIRGREFYCPSGKVGLPYVENYNHNCVYFFSGRNGFFCCEDAASFYPCTHTGMISAFTIGHAWYKTLFKTFKDTLSYDAMWPFMYEVKKGNAEFLCHWPVGYLWHNMYPSLHGTTPPSEYLPTDHVDITTKLKTCQANKDCGINEFCGDVMNFSRDFKAVGKCKKTMTVCKMREDCKIGSNNNCELPAQPNVDPNQHFCYKRPEITGNNADKSQYAMKPTERNLLFCGYDTDCANGADSSGYCHKGLAPKGLWWSRFIPNPDPTLMGAWKQHPGLCVEAKPLAHIFSHSFDQLSPSDKQGDAGKKYLAVDYEVGKHRNQLKKCTKNAECSDKQFCGNIFSLTHPANFDSLNTFCFTVPEIAAPHNSNTKYTILPESSNLVPCNTNEDCRTGGTDGNSFCHIGTGHQYVGRDGLTKKLYKGLCAQATVCDTRGPVDLVWKLGGAPKIESCDKNADCDGGGNTKIGDNAQESFESFCVKGKTFPDVNLCCYRKTDRCKYGKVVKGEIRCSRNTNNSFAECYGGLAKVLEQNTKLDTWCDSIIEQCCQDPAIGFCPDGQTPLFNEPQCVFYDERDPKSGECLTTGAMCRFGHCCPKAEVNSTGYLNKPEYSYQTNQACTPGTRPLQFLGGYCEPETGRVMIIGNLSTDGIPLTLSDSLKTCQIDANCSMDNSKLCIYEESTQNSIAHCYHNPKTWEPPRDIDATYLIICIVVVVLMVIALAAFIGDSVFYKLKLKNKKNVTKKKGKNKKKPEKKGKKDKKTSKTPTTPTTPTTSKSTSTTGKTRSGVSTGGSPSII